MADPVFNKGLVYDAQGNQLKHQKVLFQANSHCFYYRFLAHEVHVPFQHQILFENEHLPGGR